MDEGIDVMVLLSLQYLFMVVRETTGICVCVRVCMSIISAKLVSFGNSICIFNKRTLRSILIIKANEMHYFSVLFGKELYMFWTDLLSIIGSLNNVFTSIGICHSYVACLLARSASRQAT